MRHLSISGDNHTTARWMAAMAIAYGHIPRLRYLAAHIVEPFHSYQPGLQARELATWVKQNIRYIKEAGEQLQTPIQTIRTGIGDCDDLVVLTAALATAIGLRWRFHWYGKPFRHVAIDLPGDSSPWQTYELTLDSRF